MNASLTNPDSRVRDCGCSDLLPLRRRGRKILAPQSDSLSSVWVGPPRLSLSHCSPPSFIVALSISFRMSSAYARWWEGRTEWDKISALSRNIARTIWLHVPEQKPTEGPSDTDAKQHAITLLHAFAVALKHHLRGQRDWDSLDELKRLLTHLPHVCLSSSSSIPPHTDLKHSTTWSQAPTVPTTRCRLRCISQLTSNMCA